MLKKITVFTLFLGLNSFGQTELKFNLATAPLLVPNIGIEVKISENSAIQYKRIFYNDRRLFHMTQIFSEFRFYPIRIKRNFFVGAHVGYGCNIRLPKWIANLSGSEFKEEGSYQYGRNAFSKLQ